MMYDVVYTSVVAQINDQSLLVARAKKRFVLELPVNIPDLEGRKWVHPTGC